MYQQFSIVDLFHCLTKIPSWDTCMWVATKLLLSGYYCMARSLVAVLNEFLAKLKFFYIFENLDLNFVRWKNLLKIQKTWLDQPKTEI